MPTMPPELAGTKDVSDLAMPTRLRVGSVLARMQALYPQFTVWSVYRTAAQQDALYCMGRTTLSYWPCLHEGVSRPVGTCTRANYPLGIAHPLGKTVTSLRGGQSAHNWRLACDLYPPVVDDLSGDFLIRYGLPRAVWDFYWREARAVGLWTLGTSDPGHLEEPGFAFLGSWALNQFVVAEGKA